MCRWTYTINDNGDHADADPLEADGDDFKRLLTLGARTDAGSLWNLLADDGGSIGKHRMTPVVPVKKKKLVAFVTR